MVQSVGKGKVVLVVPNLSWFGKRGRVTISIAALLLTSMLKNKFDFALIDANGKNLSEEDVRQELEKFSPDAVLITVPAVECYRHAHKIAELARECCPHSQIILGGVYATVLPEVAVEDKNIDWVFVKHAEERIEKFLELLFANKISEAKNFPGIWYLDENGNKVENKIDTHIWQVKTMVKPDYSLVDLTPCLIQDHVTFITNSTEPSATVLTSYGCPYNCVFCASRTINGRGVAFRPVDDVVEEIDYLVEKYGVKCLTFSDDAILADKKRFYELIGKMVDKGHNLNWRIGNLSAWLLDDEMLEFMKKTGCTQIMIAVESGNQRVLSEIIKKPLKLDIVPNVVKKCRELGIDCPANFVIGFPGETWEEIRDTFKFAEECDFDLSNFLIATPLPKTDLYKICLEQNLLPENFSFTDPDFYGFAFGFISTDEFTPLELAVLRSFEWDRINFSTPEKIARAQKILKISPERLAEYRKFTRRRLGLHFEGMSENAMDDARIKMLREASRQG